MPVGRPGKQFATVNCHQAIVHLDDLKSKHYWGYHRFVNAFQRVLLWCEDHIHLSMFLGISQAAHGLTIIAAFMEYLWSSLFGRERKRVEGGGVVEGPPARIRACQYAGRRLVRLRALTGRYKLDLDHCIIRANLGRHPHVELAGSRISTLGSLTVTEASLVGVDGMLSGGATRRGTQFFGGRGFVH